MIGNIHKHMQYMVNTIQRVMEGMISISAGDRNDHREVQQLEGPPAIEMLALLHVLSSKQFPLLLLQGLPAEM